MAQRRRHFVGGFGAAVNEEQFAALLAQLDDICDDSVDVQVLAAADFDDDHGGWLSSETNWLSCSEGSLERSRCGVKQRIAWDSGLPDSGLPRAAD